MRLTKNRIEEVVKHVAGEEILPTIKKLKPDDYVSEFKIAEKLKIDIKKVRNMLYKLYEYNLVDFTRKKDSKKGWYIYYWRLKRDQIKYLYKKLKKEKLELLEKKLKKEKKEQFFICENQCTRLNFDQAVDFEFHCPECGELVKQEDNIKKIKNIKSELKEIKKILRKEK